MPLPVTKLQVFVASPGDVDDERDCMQRVVERLNRGIAAEKGFVLEFVRWETHAWPAIGQDAQDVINRELGTPDIFVGIMWKRFGTPTHRADSGTAEEFDRAFEVWQAYRHIEVMFYFSRKPFYPDSDQDLEQMRKVSAFRKGLADKGVFFREYEGAAQFEHEVQDHLTQVLRRWRREETETKPAPPPPRPASSEVEVTPLDRMLEALREEKFRWRSIERLAIAGGVSEQDALKLLRTKSEIVFGKGKTGRRIARLKDR